MINVRISSDNTCFESEIELQGSLSESELLTVRNKLSKAMEIVERHLERTKEDKE